MAKKKEISAEQVLFNDLSQLIEQSQQKVVSQVNNTLTILFWNIGRRINEEVLKNKRAEYAGQIVSTLSIQLKKINTVRTLR